MLDKNCDVKIIDVGIASLAKPTSTSVANDTLYVHFVVSPGAFKCVLKILKMLLDRFVKAHTDWSGLLTEIFVR